MIDSEDCRRILSPMIDHFKNGMDDDWKTEIDRKLLVDGEIFISVETIDPSQLERNGISDANSESSS